MKDIYDVLIENLTNERMDSIVVMDKEFRQLDKNLTDAIKRYNRLSLSKKDAKVVAHILDAYGLQSSRYAALAYGQGVIDAVQLLKKIGVI